MDVEHVAKFRGSSTRDHPSRWERSVGGARRAPLAPKLLVHYEAGGGRLCGDSIVRDSSTRTCASGGTYASTAAVSSTLPPRPSSSDEVWERFVDQISESACRLSIELKRLADLARNGPCGRPVGFEMQERLGSVMDDTVAALHVAAKASRSPGLVHKLRDERHGRNATPLRRNSARNLGLLGGQRKA